MNEQLLLQRENTKQGALTAFRAGIDCIQADSDPEFRTQHLVELAQGAATRGMWETFSEYFGEDDAESLTTVPTPADPLSWPVAFGAGDYIDRMQTYIQQDPALRTSNALKGLITHTGCGGSITAPFFIAQHYLGNNEQALELAFTSAAVYQAGAHNWEYLSTIDASQISSSGNLSIAYSAAHAGRFEEAKNYITLGLEQAKDKKYAAQTSQRVLRELANGALGSLIEEATDSGALMAAMEATHGLPETPLVDLAQIRRMQTFRDLKTLITDGDYEAALWFMVNHKPHEIDAPQTGLDTAIAMRDWEYFTAHIDNLPADIICLAGNLAASEGELEMYEFLSHNLAAQDPREGQSFRNPLRIDGAMAAAVVVHAARQNNWRQVYELLPHTPADFTNDIAVDIVAVPHKQGAIPAMAQVLTHLQKFVPGIINDILCSLHKTLPDDNAHTLLNTLQQSHGYREQPEEYFKRQTIIARTRAENDDWGGALHAIHAVRAAFDMHDYPKESPVRKECVAPGTVALVALRSLHAIKRSELLHDLAEQRSREP